MTDTRTDDKKKASTKTVRLSEEQHKKAKIAATEKGKTIQEYVEELIDQAETRADKK